MGLGDINLAQVTKADGRALLQGAAPAFMSLALASSGTNRLISTVSCDQSPHTRCAWRGRSMAMVLREAIGTRHGLLVLGPGVSVLHHAASASLRLRPCAHRPGRAENPCSPRAVQLGPLLPELLARNRCRLLHGARGAQGVLTPRIAQQHAAFCDAIDSRVTRLGPKRKQQTVQVRCSHIFSLEQPHCGCN